MELLNDQTLYRFSRKHRDASSWLANWAISVVTARWHSIVDVRKQYPSADGVKVRPDLVVTVFNVRGNEYRLLTEIAYDLQQITVLNVLTHAEYDQNKWKRR